MKEAANGPSGDAIGADLDRITEHVAKHLDRSGVRGLAIFSCAPKGLWEVIGLPVPVANRIVVNQSPAVGTLESIVQELEPPRRAARRPAAGAHVRVPVR